MNELCFVTNMTGSEVAAWVQAIGAILGIAIAIMVPFQQHRNDRRLLEESLKAQKDEARAAECRKLKVIEIVVLHVGHGIKAAANAVLEAKEDDPSLTRVIKVHWDLLKDTNKLVTAIPMHEQVSPELVNAMFTITTAGEQMADYLSRFLGKIQDGTFSMAEAVATSKVMKETAEVRMNRLRRIVNAILSVDGIPAPQPVAPYF